MAAAPVDYRAAATEAIRASLSPAKPPEPAQPDPPPAPATPEPLEPKPPATPAEKPPEPLARAYQAIAKREEALRTKEAEVAALKSKADRWERLQGISSPSERAKEAGLSVEAWLDEQMAGGPKPQAQGAPELAALRQQLAEMQAWKKEQTEAATMARAQADERSDIASLAAFARSAGDKFELTAQDEASQRAAYQLIRDHHRVTGALPEGSPEAAMTWALGLVEAELTAKAERLLQAKRFAGRLAAAVPKPAVAPEASDRAATPRTLTNAATGAPPPPEAETLDRDVLRARAAAIIAGR